MNDLYEKRDLEWAQLQEMVNRECIEQREQTEEERKAELEAEQKRIMNEYIVNELTDNEKVFLEDVEDKKNKKEIVYVNLRKMGVRKAIVINNDNKYEPWYNFLVLAEATGYSKPNDLFKENGLLAGMESRALESLLRAFTSMEIIDPDDVLEDKRVYNMRSLYIPHKVATTFMILARQQKKFRAQAQIFIDLMDKIDTITNDVINKLNRIVVEYRHRDEKRQLEDAQRDKHLLIRYQQREVEIQEREERIQQQHMLFVNEKYQDVILEKNHIAYIFSSPEYLAREPPIIKFGVSDKPSRRLREHQCSCPTGLYYSQIMTYNSIASERSIKMMLEAILLKFKPNSSGADEWYEISSLDRAKEILNQVISNTNNEYENVLTERQKLRESLI